MNRSNWSTERRTKAALANGGEEDDTSAGGDETSTLSGGRRISRRTMLRDEIVEDSDEDDTDTDDELPGAYAITRSTENNAEAIQQEWDPTEQTQSPLDCSSSRTADEERESDPLSIPLGAQVRPASSKDLNAKESRRNISNRIRRPYNERKWLVVLGAALCVAGVAIVTTVVILVVSANEQQVQVGDPEPDRCEYKDQIMQVDPFLQCRCRGEISIINEDVEDAMESVKNFLSTKYVKQFPANSCEPQNKALVWVSASYAKAGGNELLMPRWQVQTRYALAVFFDTSGGNNWPSLTNWLTGNKVCAWANIQCDSDGQVIRLELKDNNVIGSINPELGLLTKLQSLDISRNKLSGSIPPDVWVLPNLEELLLGYTDIGGEIPSSLRDYSTSLKKLSLPETKIEGKLPSLTGLAGLVEINLNSTRLTGTIPEDWGGLMQLELLDLSWIRYLDGWLPTSFSALTGLKSINLSESGLAGSIPEYMAEWTSLEHLSFVNAMRGSIPTFFGSFTNLVSLVIDFSGVTGTIPSELGLCTELEMLGIGLNRLKGTLPRELGNLKNLIEFTLDGNKDISGSVPAEFGDLEKLEKLSISGTGISGTIPNELCRIEISITESDFLDCTCCKGDDTA